MATTGKAGAFTILLTEDFFLFFARLDFIPFLNL
jgi:hypothetical protein